METITVVSVPSGLNEVFHQANDIEWAFPTIEPGSLVASCFIEDATKSHAHTIPLVTPHPVDEFRLDAVETQFDETVQATKNLRDSPSSMDHYLGPNTRYVKIGLEEVISIAFSDAKVLRSLNATVVNNPQSVTSSFDPLIQRTDPLIGFDASVSAFDPTFSSSAFYFKNDDVFNNPTLGGGANEIRDDVTELETGINKIGRYGTQWSLQSSIQNSDSSNPVLLFQDSWTTALEGTLRQPLLRGRGEVNQILGPNAIPGQPNNRGILLALKDIEIAEYQFEFAVQNMVREIVESYWELSLAYRRLEASVEVCELAFETWQAAKARLAQGLTGGAADEEALARAQYYRLRSQVNADIQGDRSDGQLGVLQADANLRRLLGLEKIADELLYPVEMPFIAPTQFDSDYLESHAIANRFEIRQQSTLIEQLQLELRGLHNLVLPRLDLLMTVRNNGFGDDLTGDGPRFNSAYQDFFTGDHFESEFGVSYEIPIGARQAKATVRNAQLRLEREKAIMDEQQQQIRFEVRRSLQAVYRHQEDLDFQSSRMDAAMAAAKARIATLQTGVISIDELLIVQQQLLEAKRAYFNTVLSIQRSRLQLEFQSGNLLSAHQVGLSR